MTRIELVGSRRRSVLVRPGRGLAIRVCYKDAATEWERQRSIRKAGTTTLLARRGRAMAGHSNGSAQGETSSVSSGWGLERAATYSGAMSTRAARARLVNRCNVH